LDAAGRLTVVTARRTATAMLATPPSVARLELVVEAGRGLGPDPVILALAEGPGRIGRALAASFRPGGLTPLWRGETGPRPDGSVRRVELATTGLRTWIERPDAARCDGAAVELDAEGYDPNRRTMRPIAPRLGIPSGAEVLAATASTARAVPRVLSFRAASASSRLAAGGSGPL